MTDSTFIIGIILILLASPSIILLFWLLYRKSILFKMFFAFAIPLDLCALFGFIIGYKGLVHFIWAIPVLILTFILALRYLTKEVVKPTEKIRDVTASLQRGNVNVSLEDNYMKGNNEVSQAMQMLDKLTNALKGLVIFANNIGKGDLSSEIIPTSDEDEIAMSMLGMRDNLKTAEKEKINRQEEDEKRNWVTVGLAKFAEILRSNNDNLEELSYVIISNLVKYTGANQAAIFILNNEDASHPFLEMTACYAYERRKYVNKTVELGEGLIGACFLEQESIYMTKVPRNYIRITSGLGDEAPGVLLLVPLKVNENIYGVIEIAAFTVFEPHVKEFIEKTAESIASTIGSVKIHIQTNKLLEMSKEQAEEMANQEEELRQNMEEMQATQEESRRRETELSETLSQVQKLQQISEDKEYETQQLYKSIMDTLNAVEFSADGILEVISSSVLELFGNVNEEDFIGRTFAETYAGGQAEGQEIWNKLKKGEQITSKVKIDKVNTEFKYIPVFDRNNQLRKVITLVMVA